MGEGGPGSKLAMPRVGGGGGGREPYIMFSLMIRRIQLQRLYAHWRYAPPPPLHKRLYISETVQIPSPKPYIFLFFMVRRIQLKKGDISKLNYLGG